MSEKLPMVAIPLQVLRTDHKRSVSRELQIVTSPSSSSSPFHLPDGWIVEERPRASKPSHVDRYYYEPHTGRQFRSLLSVKRHLTGETRGDYLIAKRMVPESENGSLLSVKRHLTGETRGDYLVAKRMVPESENDANYIESGSGQRFGFLRAVEKFVVGETACSGSSAATATPELMVKSGTGEQRARGVRSSRKPAHKHSSVAEEDKSTPESLKHTIQSPHSEKLDSQKKTKLEKDNRASVHNYMDLKHSSVAEEDKSTPESLKHTVQSPHSEKLDSQKKTKLEKDNRASVHNYMDLKHSSVAEEDKSTPESLKHTIQSPHSEKLDSQKKTKLEKDNRASVHNLTAPPPEKVSWVLSGIGGFWSPFLDGAVIPESEKLKWSEAFVLSIRDDGVINS